MKKYGLFNLDPLDLVDSGAMRYELSLCHCIFKFGNFLPILKTLPKFPAIRYCRPVHCQKAWCSLGKIPSTHKYMLENQLSLVFHN